MDKIGGKAKEWIFAARKKGMSNHEIEGEMLKKGYSQKFINDLITEFPRHGKWAKYATYAIIIIGVLGIGAFIYINVTYFTPKDCRTDDLCFTDLANQCRPALLKENIVGSAYNFSAKNCVLTKTVEYMNDSEPLDMIDLLEGKSMDCPYSKGQFDANLLTTVSLGIDNCNGELKDTLGDILESL